MSHLESDDEGVIASTMRRIADRLDPPHPAQPVYRGRGAFGLIDFDDPALRGAVVYRGTNIPASLGVNAYARGERPRWGDGAGALVERCRGDACSEGHTYTAGCLLANVVDRYQDGRDSTMGPLRDTNGLPNYAHDAHCNTIHEAGPDDCPPTRDEPLTPAAAEVVARVAQDEAELMARMRQGGHGRGKGPLMSTRRPQDDEKAPPAR